MDNVKLHTRASQCRPLEPDPFDAVIECQGAFMHARQSARVQRRHLLVEAYRIAQAFLADDEEWQAFLERYRWPAILVQDLPLRHDAGNVMRSVLIFCLGEPGRRSVERAYRYADALEPLLADDVDVATVASMLRTCGIIALVKSAEKRRCQPVAVELHLAGERSDGQDPQLASDSPRESASRDGFDLSETIDVTGASVVNIQDNSPLPAARPSRPDES